MAYNYDPVLVCRLIGVVEVLDIAYWTEDKKVIEEAFDKARKLCSELRKYEYAERVVKDEK